MKRATAIVCAALAAAALLAGCGGGAKQEGEPAASPAAPQSSEAGKPVRVSAEGSDAAEPAVADAADGTAYVSWVEHRADKGADVFVARVDAEGKAAGAPARVNPKE